MSFTFSGDRVNFYLLTPMGICYLVLAAWLIVRGFADPEAETRPVGGSGEGIQSS